ncbi:hypothetical protein N5C66_22675 [Rhizobium pusense]|uniref:hypothetical protein n=1 Tax=Agrobacterium pusense TaxID=648995 RepID=UPI0013008454|nr:hypothetical protein [Agrobacterium pusense]MDH0910458.1 hypothetical protein [Agrobacterium pusense]MDH1098427.1 hypothetical protein [Agrobacterium pusense]MDH1114537.1 hypothetical protein [Agrobacterium pusense]MDH2195699.1 hypothetical protein [Agrobacterium pusense]
MKRRAFLQGVAFSVLASKTFGEEYSVAAPFVRPAPKSRWSVLDFQGQSFRAKLENAVREAAGSGINIQLPGGAPHDLDAPIEVSSQDIVRVALSGEGMASTVIRCDGVGISLNGAPGSQYSFKGISFQPQRKNQGTALKLEWTKATIGKGFAIEDVGFGSNAPDDQNFFARGLEIRNKGNGQITGCWFNGLSDTDPQGEGLVLASSNDVVMADTHMYNLSYACRSDGATSLEGFKVHGCYMVRVGYGVFFEAKPIGLPYIEVALSHINACYEAVHLKGYSQVNVIDNLIYGRNDINAGTEQTDIFLDTCPSATIARNKFYSGMDRTKAAKTAIKAVGSIRNSNISENLASNRTTFLNVLDNGVSGAQDIVISKNRPERDLKGRTSVTEMYSFSNSPLHKRIIWEAFDRELSTIGAIKEETQLATGDWQVVPFIPDGNAENLGIDLKVSGQPGEFIVPPGVTEVAIDCRVHLKAHQESGVDLRIVVDNAEGIREVAFGSAFGDEVSVVAEADALPVTIGSRIRIELKSAHAASITPSPQMTNVVFSPR